MTDKQIIIDGFKLEYIKELLYNGQRSAITTKIFEEIIEKLESKEQECEELKKQYNCYACDTCKGKEDYINLKRHCENAIKSLHNKQAEFDQLKTDREEVLKQLEFVRTFNTVQEAEIRKYSKTLTEIKEIAEKCRSSLYGYDQERYPKQILQKISEVEDETAK